MLSWPPSVRIVLTARPADLRRGFDGLARMATEMVRQDPLSGALFVIRNRKGDRLKVLDWAGDAYALWFRRLERGTSRFPACEGEAVEVRVADLTLILEGIDLSEVRRRSRFERQPA
ncbi:MAG: IS66 family insertion sequence element accessory protein TnpB [Isosphaeraceae bacterium]